MQADGAVIARVLYDHRFSVVDDPRKKREGVIKWREYPGGGYMLNREYELGAEEAMLLMGLYLEDELGPHVASTVGHEAVLMQEEKAPLNELAGFLMPTAKALNPVQGAQVVTLQMKQVPLGCTGVTIDLNDVQVQLKLIKQVEKWSMLMAQSVYTADVDDNSKERKDERDEKIEQMNEALQNGNFQEFIATALTLDMFQTYFVLRRLALRRGRAVSRVETLSSLIFKLVTDSDTTPPAICVDGELPAVWIPVLDKLYSDQPTAPVPRRDLSPEVTIREGWAGVFLHMLIANAGAVGLAAGYMPPKVVDFALLAFNSQGVPHPRATLQVLLDSRVDKAEMVFTLSSWRRSLELRPQWNAPLSALVKEVVKSLA